MAMGRRMKLSGEICARVLEDARTMPVSALSVKYKVHYSTIYDILHRNGVPPVRRPVKKREAVAPKRVASAAPGPQSAMIPVEIDPQGPGTAAALIDALAKIDGGEGRVKIELSLTVGEMGRLLERLGDGQRAAFLSAGLRAALLA
jgi:hypothetical protein